MRTALDPPSGTRTFWCIGVLLAEWKDNMGWRSLALAMLCVGGDGDGENAIFLGIGPECRVLPLA